MKKIFIIVLCLLLCSCANKNTLEESLDLILDNPAKLNIRQNNYTNYLDYYLPSDLFEEDASELSFTFYNDNTKIITNLNVAGIIENKYYREYMLKDEGFFDNEKNVYSKKATYINASNSELEFVYNLYKYDDIYLVHFYSTDVNAYAMCDYDNIVFTTQKIFQIAKGIDVNYDAIITNYSSKDVIDYQKKQIDLFNNAFPINGRIDDLMIDSSSND